MNELRKFVAPEFVFGVGSLELVAQYAKNYSVEKALVVTDNNVTRAGWLKKVTDLLESENIHYVIYNNITPNPRDYEIHEGANVYLQNNCNIIISVGGGSVIDAAKGIGLVSQHSINILDFEGVDLVEYSIPPLICIPTTSGSSADVSQFAIINDTQRKIKIAIISRMIVPDVSIIDPSTLITMDDYLTACTSIDALVHAIEAYVSTASSPFTDLFALKAIETIAHNLPLCMADPKNLQFRIQLMQASLNAGLAFSNASLGNVHAMAHSLGGYKDLPHGECNAMLLPAVINYNYESQKIRYNDIAKYFGLELKGNDNTDKRLLIDRIKAFIQSTGIESTLKDRGVSYTDLTYLATAAYNDPCSVTNPRESTIEDIKVIYEEAL